MSEIQGLTPIGRIVSGRPMVHAQGSYNGVLRTKTDGTPKIESFIGVAIPKSDPATMPIIQSIDQIKAYNGHAANPAFATKYDDGDDPKFAGKEGYAGCYILKFSSGYPIPYRQNDANYTPIDPVVGQDPQNPPVQPVKRGDYVKVAFTCAFNNNQQNAGVFLNPVRVLFMQPGEPIISGPSDNELFGAAGTHVMAGAPAAGVSTPAATPAAMPPAGGSPAPVATPGAAPAAGNQDFLNPVANATPAATPAPAATPVVAPAGAPTNPTAVVSAPNAGVDMDAFLHPDIKAQGHTYASLSAQFSVEVMKQQGWLLDQAVV